MVADIIINHVPFERFRGDGVTVSTPTGSTAYNKSLGGAVLHPTIEALQLTEIASLNNRVYRTCLLYTSPSPRDVEESRMPSSA